MQRNNTSGVKGVKWENKVHPSGDKYTRYAIATWYTIDGRLKSKSFSVKKYGDELALLWRVSTENIK